MLLCGKHWSTYCTENTLIEVPISWKHSEWYSCCQGNIPDKIFAIIKIFPLIICLNWINSHSLKSNNFYCILKTRLFYKKDLFFTKFLYEDLFNSVVLFSSYCLNFTQQCWSGTQNHRPSIRTFHGSWTTNFYRIINYKLSRVALPVCCQIEWYVYSNIYCDTRF